MIKISNIFRAKAIRELWGRHSWRPESQTGMSAPHLLHQQISTVGLTKPLFILIAVLIAAGCEKQNTSSAIHNNERIVSIAPNVTEILYALGASNRVVGVSKYSEYPPEATEKPCVGGTYDPNWEMIVSLQPDLVIGLETQEEIAAQLKQLGIDFLGVPHERVEEIMQSILIIGKACGAEEKAQELFQTLENKAGQVSKLWKDPPPASRTPPKEGNREQSTANIGSHESPPSEGFLQGGVGFKKPRVLVCIGHDEQLSRMYIAARNTFYDDLINLAGGSNACEQTAIKYPEISPEGLHAMQPDLIIDLVPDTGKKGGVQAQPASEVWKPYRAVIITNQYAFIPGPRFTKLLKGLTSAIQSENRSE